MVYQKADIHYYVTAFATTKQGSMYNILYSTDYILRMSKLGCLWLLNLSTEPVQLGYTSRQLLVQTS